MHASGFFTLRSARTPGHVGCDRLCRPPARRPSRWVGHSALMARLALVSVTLGASSSLQGVPPMGAEPPLMVVVSPALPMAARAHGYGVAAVVVEMVRWRGVAQANLSAVSSRADGRRHHLSSASLPRPELESWKAVAPLRRFVTTLDAPTGVVLLPPRRRVLLLLLVLPAGRVRVPALVLVLVLAWAAALVWAGAPSSEPSSRGRIRSPRPRYPPLGHGRPRRGSTSGQSLRPCWRALHPGVRERLPRPLRTRVRRSSPASLAAALASGPLDLPALAAWAGALG